MIEQCGRCFFDLFQRGALRNVSVAENPSVFEGDFAAPVFCFDHKKSGGCNHDMVEGRAAVFELYVIKNGMAGWQKGQIARHNLFSLGPFQKTFQTASAPCGEQCQHDGEQKKKKSEQTSMDQHTTNQVLTAIKSSFFAKSECCRCMIDDSDHARIVTAVYQD